MMKSLTAVIFTAFSTILCGQSFEAFNQRIELNLQEEYWNEAEKLLDYCLQNFDLDNTTKANFYHNLGYCKLEREDYLGSKYYLTKALDLKVSNNPQKNGDYAKTAQLLGDLSLKIGDYNHAKQYLIDAGQAYQNTYGEQSDEYVKALVNIGQFYEAIGDYPMSHQYFTNALLISEAIHESNSADYADVLNHIGRIFIKNADLEEAEKYLHSANAIFHELGSKYALEYIETLEGLAILYEHKGDFSQAEKLLLSIEREKRSIPDVPEELLLETLNDLGVLYLNYNNIQKSKRYFEEAKEISKRNLGTEHKFYATAVNNLSAIAKQEGNFEYAKELVKSALSIYESTYGRVHPQFSTALNNLASIERQLGDFAQSEVHYKEVLEIDKVIFGEEDPNYATALNNMGILYSTTGRHQLAESYYKRAMDIRKRTLGANHPSYARSVENMGLHYFALNDFANAERYLSEAIEIQIHQLPTIFPTITEKERALYYKKIREDIERYDFIAYKLLKSNPDLIQKILNFQILTKGILFTSSERIANTVYSSFDNNLIELYSKWLEEKTKLAGYYQLDESKLERYGINISEIEQGIEAMEKRMISSSEAFSGLVRTEVDWRDIRRVLKPEQALTVIIRFREFSLQTSESTGNYGFTDKVHYVFIVLKKDSYINPEYVVVENGAALEARGFSLYRNSLKYDTELKTSYLNYWAPVDKLLQGVNRVIVSPDGVFYKINPNIFLTTDNKFIIDKYYVSYITNSSDLAAQNPQASGEFSAVLIGDPDFGKISEGQGLKLTNLPGAKKEIEEIAAILENKGWIVRKYLEAQATESKIQTVYQPTVLHIATHGYFTGNDPILAKVTPNNNPLFKSGLFLKGANDSYAKYLSGENLDSRNDGIFSSYEIMNINLTKTKLVVLSACETALGDIMDGEGVYGLQRAIMVAGAQNVITSLTKVDDVATQQLMTYFYELFLISNSVDQAFKEAQLKLRKQYSDPKVWGAFLLTGNG